MTRPYRSPADEERPRGETEKGNVNVNNQTISRALGLALAAALLLGCVFAVSGTQRVEPPDPREENTALLRPEALSTGRAAGLGADSDTEMPSDDLSGRAQPFRAAG